ncbi:MAG TPA: hypothetical protein VF173_36710 [Thermoanaerobaculia bacterium]|nr:hypothetical protein [Thermoanaerobaculia bacterium]
MRKRRERRTLSFRRIVALALGALAVLTLAPAGARAVTVQAPAASAVKAPAGGTQVVAAPPAAASPAVGAQTSIVSSAVTAERLKVTTFADGTVSVTLTPAYSNVWILRLNPDGSQSQFCVDGSDVATALAAPPSAPASHEVK